MKLKTSHPMIISLIVIPFILTCTKLNLTGSESSKPILIGIQDTSVSINDSFNIQVNLKNPGLGDLRFVWDIKEKGIHDTLQDSILRISFKNPGIFNVVVSAISRDDISSDPDTIAIEVYAKPPIIKISTMDSIHSVNDSVKFTVSSFDTDGVVKSYLWSFNGTKFDSTKDSTIKHVWPSDSFGSKILYVKCIDDDKLLSKTATFHFIIVQNKPFVKAMADTTIFTNDTVILHASGSDSNGTILKYIWSFDNKTYDTTTNPTFKTIWPISSPGIKTLYVKDLDEDHLFSDIDSMHINVLLGEPKIHAMKDTSINVNDTLILHAFAVDTNGTIKKYLWSFDKTVWDTTTDSLKKSFWPITNYGKKTLYVKAMDDDAISSNIDSTSISVHLMAPVIMAMPDTAVAINDTILLHASATDSNGTVIKFVWTVDGKRYDTTTTGMFKTFWPLSAYGQKPDFVKALETEGTIPKNDTIFIGVAFVYAVDNDGIPSKAAYIILNFHLYKPTVKAMNDTAVAVNDTVQLHAAGADSNGTIVHYLWSLDGITFDTTNIPTYKTIWSPTNFGIKKVYVKVIDDDGLVSNLDSTRITVHQYAPVVSAICANRHIRDTIISFKDSLLVGIAATDTNGRIKKYFWDVGADGWDDSTNYPDSIRYIKYPAGGYVTIVVGAKDDDGIMGTDTLHVLFNRPPTSCGLKTDYNTDKGGWSDFNYSTSKGGIQVSFTGEDPDGSHDNLKYDLFWGTDQNNLSKQYSGVNTTVSISDIPIQTQVYWKVVAKDLYGDSATGTGIYTSSAAPPVGLFWNLVTDNALFNQYSIKYPMASFTFDNKMWVVTYNSTQMQSPYLNRAHYVFTSGSQ